MGLYTDLLLTVLKRYQSGEITLIHGQNSVISYCEGHGQRALAQGRKLSRYSRIKDLPETYQSSFIYFNYANY